MVIAVSRKPTFSPGLMEPECEVRRIKSRVIDPESSHVVRKRRLVGILEEGCFSDELRTIRIVEKHISRLEAARSFVG
jgi:hypothetical protein